MQTREEIINIIKEYRSNLIGCSIKDFDNKITFIVDSKNSKLSKTKKRKEEIQILNYKDGGIIINLPDECSSELSEIVEKFGVNYNKIGELLQKKYEGKLVFYYSVRSYIFTDEHLKAIDPNVRKLEKSEEILFNEFMESCSEKDKDEVYMDFSASFHNFYAYFYENKIVAIGEYSKNYNEDNVVMISIIVKEEFRGKGYGKALVKVITAKSIENGRIPQYRADPENIPSRKIARSLGYEEIFEGCTLFVE